MWQKSLTRRNDARLFSSAHDTIVVYALNLKQFGVNALSPSDKQRSTYTNRDDDPRGDWLAVPLHAPGIRPNLTYPVTLPSGRTVMPPPGRCWGTTETQYLEWRKDGRVYFGLNGDGMPQRKKFWDESTPKITPWTWWPYEEVGENREANLESKGIAALRGADRPFATPKPERLLERVLHIATNPGDTVLDCFAGSGTTAAVAHKMGRRWVTGDISEANTHDFVVPRLTATVEGCEPGGITDSRSWSGGGGFRCLDVGPSMYEVANNGLPLLADWATNGRFSRGVAAQLDFDFESDGAPFCGRRGRMRLAVLDGAVGAEEVQTLVAALGDDERVTVVAKVVLPGAEEMLGVLSKGSRIRKAPRDVLADGSRKARRRERTAP